MTSVVEQATVAVASIGLHEAEWPEGPFGPSHWAELKQALVFHRVVALAALAAHEGRLPLVGEQVEELRHLDTRAAAATLAADAILLDLAAELDAEGIPFRVLKGGAAAALDWSLPARRRYFDVDVLVRADDLARSVLSAERLGATRRVPELRPGFDRRFAKSVTMDSPRGGIDLHRSLVLGPHCFLVDVDDLWERPRSFQLGGRDLAALSEPVALVHYAMHATITGFQRLGSLRDFVECGRHADLDAAAAVATRWRATAIVQRACERVRDRLGFGRDHQLVRWGESLRPTRQELRLTAAYGPASHSDAARVRATLRHVPGPLGKARYALAVMWPGKANRAARHRTASDQVSRVREELGARRSVSK